MALVGGPLGSDECDRIFGAALRGERVHFRVIDVDGSFVGVIGLVMRTDGQHELGVLLRSDRQRRGVGRRAVDAFVDEVRNSGPTTRILIGHRAENRGMARLVEHLMQRFSCAPLGRGEADPYWVLDLTQELRDVRNSREQ